MVYRTTERGEAARAASQAKILRAAARLFARKGYDATTMQDIVTDDRGKLEGILTKTDLLTTPEHQRGRGTYAFFLWNLLNVSLWYDQWIEGPRPASEAVESTAAKEEVAIS